MSIYINKDTKVITQGITGKTGQFHTEKCQEYANGKNCFVAGVNPKKAGESIFNIPIYASVKEAASQTGATIDSATLKGKPYAIFFGFTHCPEVCPTTMVDMAALIPKLVGGVDAASLDLAASLYDAVVVQPVRVASPEIAEAAKL
ncbi:MAG TPA: SCO family protein, partial [Alicycliphilus sp.]|nr:SCO family protein [Alicycliphilus sp.]